MDASAAIVVNRRARHLSSANSPIMRAIREAAAGARIYETSSLAELDEAARTIARDRTARVVIAGGDGSYMAGITALARACGEDALPEIAFAPGGTVSTVARNWGTRDAARLVHAVVTSTGTTQPRPTLRVNDAIGFIFGAGLVATFFDEYYASSRQGNAAAAEIVAKIFAGSFVGSALARKVLTPQPMALTVDGTLLAPKAWSLVAASVVRDLGLHMLLTYRAGEALDRVHVIGSALGPMALGPQMPRVLAGRPLRGRDHLDALARELIARFPEETSYVLDGEVLRAREVRVSAGPVITVRSP